VYRYLIKLQIQKWDWDHYKILKFIPINKPYKPVPARSAGYVGIALAILNMSSNRPRLPPNIT